MPHPHKNGKNINKDTIPRYGDVNYVSRKQIYPLVSKPDPKSKGGTEEEIEKRLKKFPVF